MELEEGTGKGNDKDFYRKGTRWDDKTPVYT